MKRAVISVGIGKNYPKLLHRQAETMAKYEGEIDHITWFNELPIGCPPHEQVPYAFKSFAFLYTVLMNYDSVIWMDSAVWVQGDLFKMFEIVEREGHLIFKNGWNQANWSTDQQLQKYGLTRTEAESIPHPLACVIGAKISDIEVDNWIFEYIHGYPLFVGEWSNASGQVTDDMRCLGSRHDQSVLGFIAHKHKLSLTSPNGLISYDEYDKQSILLSKG